MIKRRFYKFTHGDKDAPSDSDSSSDSEVEAEATDESSGDEQEDSDVGKVGEDGGYESEDSSVNEVNLDSSGLASSDDELTAQNSRGRSRAYLPPEVQSPEREKIEFDSTDCLLKIKSVFKCRLCPRIVCLSEETLKTHLDSKRHARSEKLLKEGRLKAMLNEVGEIEGEIDRDSSPERQEDDTTTESGKDLSKSKKKRNRRLEEKKRLRKEAKNKGGAAERRAKRRSQQGQKK